MSFLDSPETVACLLVCLGLFAGLLGALSLRLAATPTMPATASGVRS
jgi:hypothetical protein